MRFRFHPMSLRAHFRAGAGALAALLALAALPAHSEEAEPPLPQFDILEYLIEGNTRLSDIEIERAVTPYLGEARTLREAEAARLALENAYHNAGYLTVLVAIPEQKVDDGSVILRVTEGQVERLRVKGAEYHLASVRLRLSSTRSRAFRCG